MIAGLVTVLCLVAGAPGRAQVASPALQEVIVTAQKRAESAQAIPIAITAIDAQKLAEDRVASLQDINGQVPGLVFGSFSVGQPEISIRGISTKEDGAAAAGSTVVSVDDVYIAARTAQVFDIFDLERVEVLRGPQGTLYGKNSIAGSINFITTQPGDTRRVKFMQTVGNYGRLDTGGLVTGPLTENLSGKISFSRREHEGYIRNVLVGSPYFGRRQGESETLSWRAALRWQPTEKWDITLGLDGADDDLGASNREPVGGSPPLHNCAACASNPVAVNAALGGMDPHNSLADSEGFTDRQVIGAMLRVEYELPAATFVSITSYRDSDFDWLEDSEGLPPSSTFVNLTIPAGGALLASLPASAGFTFDVNNRATEEAQQFTQELRLVSNGEGRLDWVAGLFYSDESIDRIEGFLFPALGGPDGRPSDQFSTQVADVTSAAAYAQGTYDLSDRLALTAGARYSHEKKEAGAAATIISGLPLLLRPFGFVSAEETWENVSGRLALDWKPLEDLLLYGSIATGFKSGGFPGSPSTAATATTPFEPEEAINYEIGLKSLLLERRLQLNTAVFFTDYEDLQVTRFFQPVGRPFGEFFTENAGKAESKGVEIELAALLAEGVEVGASYAYLDAQFKEFTGLPSTIGTGNFVGKTLRQAPEHTGSAYIRMERPLGESTVSGKIGWRYQSLSYYDPDNNPIAVVPSFDLLDARLAWRSPGKKWEIAAWVQNALDEEYRTHVFTQRDSRIAFALYGPPRTYGVSVTVDLQ